MVSKPSNETEKAREGNSEISEAAADGTRKLFSSSKHSRS